MALEEGGKRALSCSAFMQAWERGLPSTEFKCPHFDVAGDHLHSGMFRYLNARDHQCAVPSCKHATSFTNLTLSSSLNQFGDVLIICTDTPIIQTAKWKCVVLVLLLSYASGFWLFCFIWGYALSDPVANRRPEYSTWSIKWYVHRLEIFSACLGVSSLTVFYYVQWTIMFLPWNLRGHNDICLMVDLAEPWSVYIHS